MAKSNFIVRGGADFSGIQQEISKTEKSFKGFESRINSTFKGISEGLGINLGKLTKVGLIAAATKKLVDFGKASIDVAADMREVQNVVDVTFGSMAKDVDDFAANSIKAYGLSTLAAKRHASTMGAMLKSSGIAGEAVRDMALDLTALAADMASFYNLDNDVAFQKIMSGMSGMTQPLKELGINMNIANVEAFALSQGFNKAWREMSQAEQTMWRYKYLLHVTKDAQGDFAREIDTWSNQVKILKMQWEEFMSLIGNALVKILLPVVKFLNKVLELLIKIVKYIGKIYTMITGKELSVEANTNIADTAFDAAEGENKLADGISKAAKAAKKALAPFDELNVLQNNLGAGGSGGGLPGTIGDGGLNTIMSTNKVDDGWKIKIDDEEPKKFFIWFTDKWNGLKQMLAVPVMVPAPVFNPIPSPVYRPNWNLTPPPVPQIAFPPIIYTAYNQSLQTIKNLMTQTKTSLEHSYGQLRENLTTQTSIIGRNIQQGLSTAWSTVEGNLRTHRTNVGVIATGIGSVLAVNIGRGLSIMGRNVNNAITTVQNNLNTFGRGAASAAAEIGRSFSYNVSQGFNTAIRNFSNFVRGMGTNLRSFGSGMLSGALQTARGFVNNLVSGFQTVWSNFRNLMSNMGERVGGWFSANRSVIGKVAIGVGVGAAVAGIAIAAPQAIPFVAKGLAGLAAIPALAEGGITNGPMLAVVGDNPGGREVVSPLDDLMAMIQTAVNEAGNSGGDLYLTVKVGEDTLTEKVISNINRQNRISGETVIKV